MSSFAASESKSANVNGKRMEGDEHFTSKKPRHRPLTTLRILRGILCLVIYLSTAFMMLVYWAPLTTLVVRLFSVHYSRKATSLLFGTWLSMWPFLFEKINKTTVIFSGESVPREGRVLLFANHRTEVDWMYLWNLALRKGQLGYIKYVLKRSLMKLPIFNWGFHIFEFISVERKWEVDESIMRSKLSTFRDSQDSLWLAVFPEGTDYTEEKCVRSQQFAAENGLPILKNVLIPKTRGFYACVEALRNSLDAGYLTLHLVLVNASITKLYPFLIEYVAKLAIRVFTIKNPATNDETAKCVIVNVLGKVMVYQSEKFYHLEIAV